MTSSNFPFRNLPARLSADSLRKQAKKLVRDVAAERDDAVARARAQLPEWAPPLTLRDAQLALAREYGFAGWRDLREEVAKRVGAALEWAASEAGRAIHEPASILHECAVHGDYEGARFLIAHGVDLTIRDHRWNATAAGWAEHAAGDVAMANFLIEAEERRRSG